jgi:hypothetical protein
MAVSIGDVIQSSVVFDGLRSGMVREGRGGLKRIVEETMAKSRMTEEEEAPKECPAKSFEFTAVRSQEMIFDRVVTH